MKTFLIFMLSCLMLNATTYYVRKDGSDGNAGTADNAGGAFLTITHAETHATTAGDFVYVRAGTYDEQPTIDTSGNSGAWINFVGGTNVICRGFSLSGANYVRIIGFEITHVNNTYNAAVLIAGASTHLDIVDNYIHNTRGNGSGEGSCIGSRSGTSSYVTIRGNTLYYLGFISGYWTNNNQTAVSPLAASSSHWLIEYNHVQRSGDFINDYGTNNIVRNNFLHDYDSAHWPGSYGDAMHSDMSQPGSDGLNVGARHHVYENNFMGDSTGTHSHGFLFQDNSAYGDTNYVCRGNVFFNFGSGGIGIRWTDKIASYNNTFYKMNTVSGGGSTAMFIAYGNPDYSLNNVFRNTIIDDCNGAVAISVDPGSVVDCANNLGHTAGSHASFVSTADPLFVSPANPTRDFRLQVGSPAIGTGASFITISSADGSGTTFNVNDGQLLIDGWGLVEGDVITTGGTTTRITGISGNTVTVASSVTWTTGQVVHWGTDTTPDIGALPYGSTPLTAATISNAGTTYTVTPTGDARGVWFYVNGIPTTWDYDAPYQATIASGTVTAKAYALYAQASPVFLATDVYRVGRSGTVRAGTVRRP